MEARRFRDIFAALAFAVVLGSSRASQAQTTNPSATTSPNSATGRTYIYKIEQARGKLKDLEERLNEDGRNGWRIARVVAKGASDNTVFAFLEKAAGKP